MLQASIGKPWETAVHIHPMKGWSNSCQPARLTVHFPWQLLVVKRKRQHPAVLQAIGGDACLLMQLQTPKQHMHIC
jgi:hypothetical protein